MKNSAENNKIKKRIINFFIRFGFAIIIFILFFVLIIQIISLIIGKENINAYCLIIAIFVSIVISVLLTLFMFKQNKKYPFISYSKWIKFMFCLVLVIAFIGSINPEINIDISYARELLSFEWTIFSLILVLFLSWLIIVEKYLEKEPKNDAKGTDRFISLINKNSFYINSLSYLLNGIFIIINLILLCWLTAEIFTFHEISLFNQTLLYFNIYLSINTLQLIFLDIFSPIISKLIMCRKYKVKENDIKINIILSALEKVLEDTEKNKTVNGNDNETTKEQNDGQAEHED